jgi:hypothetical protein
MGVFYNSLTNQIETYNHSVSWELLIHISYTSYLNEVCFYTYLGEL